MKRLTGIVLTILLVLTMANTASASTHVVCDVTVLSEHSVRVELSWADGSGNNIQIVSWADEGDTMVITYRTGGNVPTGWNTRTIENDNYSFPMKVRLEEQGSEGNVFTDLSASDDGYDSIMNLYYQGIINGYTEGDFRPENLVNRAEFSKMVTLTAKHVILADLASTFPDVSNSYWGKKYIMTLANKGILSGYPSGDFGPEDQVTIGQVLKVINYTFDFYEYDIDYPYNLDFHWSNENFEALVAAGIVLTEDDFYYAYAGDTNATRLQCAELLSRVLEKINETR